MLELGIEQANTAIMGHIVLQYCLVDCIIIKSFSGEKLDVVQLMPGTEELPALDAIAFEPPSSYSAHNTMEFERYCCIAPENICENADQNSPSA